MAKTKVKVTTKVDQVLTLQGQLDKLQQRLLKTHVSKVTKLEKLLSSTSARIGKLQDKIILLTAKNTAAAVRQKVAAKDKLATLREEVSEIKTAIREAKMAQKKAHALMETAHQAEQELSVSKKKNNKKTTKRKNAAKPAKKMGKNTTETKIITADLSEPVSKISAKPKKLWKPKIADSETQQGSATGKIEQKEPMSAAKSIVDDIEEDNSGDDPLTTTVSFSPAPSGTFSPTVPEPSEKAEPVAPARQARLTAEQQLETGDGNGEPSTKEH